jgi:hypothetical protein
VWVGVAGLPVLLGLALAAPSVAAAERPAAAGGESRPAAATVLRAGPAGPASYVAPLPAPARPQGATAVPFTITYSGFTPAARAAFQRAADLWRPLLNTTVPVTVSASFEPLGPGILGSAGPSFIHRNFTGAPQPNTWYVDAIANKRSGTQRNPSADIVARFSSTFTNWHFGSGPAPTGRFDFTSVVMHELGHGLGFLGAGTVNGSTGTVRIQALTPKDPIGYDRFTENGAGRLLLSFPDNSTALGSQLRSNNLFFDSPGVRSANGGRPAKIYAPSTFNPGSSYSHLDEATFGRGNPHSLMTPQIGTAETIRSPGGITLALLRSIGW